MIGLMSNICGSLSSEEVIHLAKEYGFDGIEWSADEHVRAGRLIIAEQVHKSMEKAGLKTLSYGSDYRLRENVFPRDSFMPVVMCADILHTPTIRVWAGSLSPRQAHLDYYHRIAGELKTLSKMAALFNINVSVQYHLNTLTQDCHSAIKLLKMIDCNNLKIDWQPNPNLTQQENAEDLRMVLPHLANIHVFCLSNQGERLTLEEGYDAWKEYIKIVNNSEVNFIIEFAKDNAPEAVARDAAVLRQLV